MMEMQGSQPWGEGVLPLMMTQTMPSVYYLVEKKDGLEELARTRQPPVP